MNDDELKKLWQQQPLRVPDPSAAQLISAMQNKTSLLRRCLDARDVRELLACAVVILVFGCFYFTVYREPISRLGDLIVIGSTIFIAWKFVHTRRTTPPAPPGATVVESLRAELNSVRAQSRLLGSVLWWYLLPPTIGLLIATWGLPINLHAKIPATLFFIAVDAFLYWLNQWARSKQLLPLEAQLQSLLHSAETGEPLEETHVANLRPIVLSMAAANQVKPVEFMVAFWQLALYGEIAAIGFWFFLMLGLTMDNPDWKAKAQIPKTFAQSVLAEETNRYSVVARKVVDLLNTSNYAAVQKLYNPEMSKAFPPKETSDFCTRLAAGFGKIEKFDVSPGGYNGWIAFQLHCQRGELTMSLALDADDKISGIYFKPGPKPPVNIKSFVLRLFSWQHLLWLVPFFLAGLLYSWLLQKLTKRAVGISTLGIHLHKGQNLLLWDEIKEVRPLRILNIRSLWLIRESGEKTITPWTSLERPSDLRAAVESFAPANHPICKHLSLLRSEPSKKNIMTKTILIGIALISLGAIVFVRGREPKTRAIEYSDPVSQMLETIRVKHKFPALAAAVVVDGKIVVTNAVGFRKKGGTERVTVDDQFHLGSVTKSMTATVAAMLVEQGKISWTTTIREAFPELKSEIHPDYLGVTLEQLLSQRSGAPGDAPGDLWRKAWAANGTAAEQRLAFIKGILARKPEAKPGTKFIYSNQGYTIAGVMLEKATGKTWEDLLRSMLFEPLGMTTAGFGAPASVDKVDQPWGHTKKMLSGSEPVPPGPGADNPLAISPAGSVHCSMGDLAKYAAFHMAGERGQSELLKAESFKKLHTAVADNDDYALGWMVLKRGWANGRALMHNGSNTMFYVVVWMAPEKNCAVIVASNVGVDEAFEGCDEAAGKLIKQFFPK